MREEVFGDARLILGDCLEIIPTIGRVTHIISDPPYEDDAHRSDRKITGRERGTIATAFNFGSIEVERFEVAAKMVAICDGWLIAFCMAEGVRAWRDAIEDAGAKYKRSMVWIKPDAMPQFNGQGPAVGYESLVSAWCGTGYSKWNGGGRVGTFYHNKNNGGKNEHPTQKPLTLMKELVSLFSNQGEIILDPYMGSGSTGVAALELQRKFIGIEKNEAYFDLACRRLEEQQKQPQLFIDLPQKPVQQEFI